MGPPIPSTTTGGAPSRRTASCSTTVSANHRRLPQRGAACTSSTEVTEIADDAVQHTPVADISEDCICLAVTDAPLRFKGLLPRLAQPFLKI